MIHRRALLASTAALAACGAQGAPPAPAGPLPPLKSVAPFPVGTVAMAGHLSDPAWRRLVSTHFSQLTPEWEMKMEYILQRDGALRFDAPDRLADFARDAGARLFGHALIWYAQEHPWFTALVDDRARFAAEHDRYIAAVAGRWRGQIVGWDVVNEPVEDDGSGYRDCVWSRGLGGIDAYIIRAFEQAQAAAPEATLFLNDYDLENRPRKGAAFLRLVERLLKAGAPIQGIGVQSHLDIEIPRGRIGAFMREAAQFGLPIHVSELDASLKRGGRLPDLRLRAQKRTQQTARVAELAEAFMDLPPAQRFAFTVWGVRDSDSWLRRAENDDGQDSPLLFDDAGRPNPMFGVLAEAFAK
ncbi:1,4-beta-xylanase [Brevundimonas naejangsanensis]|uniref:Beta-xylanase n=1 Tax=Brevundimonas naejangsanensis TaxID=588932 RepID=A0A494RME4_9CAUL|nr:endo-1,4-beta-xylanase [Brevundimonas naejangsanensis]AYG95182.1 1,4-beta-xylanase [Brevundimonas naejangsanensis]